MMLFRDAPAAIRDEGVDSLIVDQIEMAGGTVAEHLGLPFVSVAAALPINLDVSVPPVNFPWSHRDRRRGPAPEPGGERGQRVDLLGGPADDQPTAPGVGAAPGPGHQRAVLKARPGRATARRPGAAGSPTCRPTSTTPAPGRTRRGGRRWTSPGPASTRTGPWCTPRWGRSRTGSSGRSG